MGEWGEEITKSLKYVSAQNAPLSPIKSIKVTDEKKAKDEAGFQEFFADMRARIKTVPDRVVLTLKYFINKSKSNTIFHSMVSSMIWDYVRNRDDKEPYDFAKDQEASTEVKEYLRSIRKSRKL